VTNDGKIQQWLAGLNRGIEIGAFDCPLPLHDPVYVDIFTEFAGQPCRVDVLADSVRLPFGDSALGYVAASHVLEHIANPLAALLEWTRVTRNGGRLYLVIPDRNHTWEHRREPVSVPHLLDDYRSGRTQSDGIHVDEFVNTLDWEAFSPQEPSAEAREHYRRILKLAISEGNDINIHFHAFEPQMFASVVDAANGLVPVGARLHLLDLASRFPEDCPNGFLAVLGVEKTGSGDSR
jgi:SAM-dependent methyltransferase